MKKPLPLDRINRAILTELQMNARMSNIELSERVGLSPSACLKRVKALEESGCIMAYLMEANLERIAHVVQAIFLIDLKDTSVDTTDAFEAWCATETHLTDLMRVSGSPDYIAFVVCTDVSEVNALIRSMMVPKLKLERVNVQFIIDRTKWFAGYPLKTIAWKEQV